MDVFLASCSLDYRLCLAEAAEVGFRPPSCQGSLQPRPRLAPALLSVVDLTGLPRWAGRAFSAIRCLWDRDHGRRFCGLPRFSSFCCSVSGCLASPLFFRSWNIPRRDAHHQLSSSPDRLTKAHSHGLDSLACFSPSTVYSKMAGKSVF